MRTINLAFLFVRLCTMDQRNSSYYVYIVRCSDDTLYTGSTGNLENRILSHNGELKGGARYTRGRRPVTLVYSEHFNTLAEARARESAIKRLTRRGKEKLVENWRKGTVNTS